MRSLLLSCALVFFLVPHHLDASQEAPGPGTAVTFERPDGAVLHGTLHLVHGDTQPKPAILLLHQAQRSGAEFDFLLSDLHALGIHTLSLDLRGHGQSTKPETLDRAFFMKLFRDANYAPPDVQAVLEWLAGHDQVDATRIAAMGGSVGANLSYVANGAGWGVKTAILLSGNAEAAADLQGDIEPFQARNVLLLAADDDHGRDTYARQLYERAAEPKHIEILEGSSAHGTDLLKESEELKQLVLDWLQRYLADD